MEDGLIRIDISEPAEIKKKLADIAMVENLKDHIGGDFRWLANGSLWGIERKSIAQYLGDIDSNLPDQMLRLATGTDIAILLVEGFPHIAQETGKIELWVWKTDKFGRRYIDRIPTTRSYNDVLLTQFSLWYCLGIIPIWSPDIDYTPGIIRSIYNWSRKPDSEHGRWIIRKPKIDISRSFERVVPLQVISQIPGIGIETARVLLRELGSVEGVFTAEDSRLLQIKGIGKKTVANIRRAFKEVYTE